jgi:ABC-2 type transport system permease protein
MRSLRLLTVYLKRYFLRWLAWRSFAFTLVANQAVAPLVGLAVWSTAVPGQPQITGYYVALLLVRMLTVSYESHTFSGDIYDGTLADQLLRPHPVVVEPLAQNAAMRIWHLIIGAPALVAVGLVTGISFAWQDLLWALPAIALAAVLRFLFTFVLAISAFWTERAHGMVGFGATLIFLLGGDAAPMHLMPAAVRPWMVALPFRAMNAFPAEVAAGLVPPGETWAGYGLQLLWIAVLLALAAMVWRAGVRRYTAVGG